MRLWSAPDSAHLPNMRLALIGCGAAARRYYLPALRKRPWLSRELVLVDTDLGHARELARDLGASRVSSDHRRVLDTVDAAIIATPHFTHYPLAIECVQSGLHVLCEKPLAESLREVIHLIDEAARRRVTVMVNNTRRLFPTSRQIKQFLSAGTIGRLVSVRLIEGQRFDWDSAMPFYVDPRVSAKGVTFDLGAHILDLLCWWLGATPEILSYQDDSFGGPESLARLRARSNGCAVEVILNRLIDLPSRYVISAEGGRIECFPDDWRRIVLTLGGDRPRIVALRTSARTYPDFVDQLLENFLQVAVGAAEPLISARDVCASIELIEHCYKNRDRVPMPWYDHVMQVSRG